MKVYLANALFSEADIAYNEMIYDRLTEAGFEVYAPQKNAEINDKSKSADSIAIYWGDTEKLEWADAIVAVLDGPVVDAGVAAEIGYMAAKYKTIYGLFTDSRESSRTIIPSKVELLSKTAESQFPYVNLYVVGAIKSNGEIFTSFDDLLRAMINDRFAIEMMSDVPEDIEDQETYTFEEVLKEINMAAEKEAKPAGKVKAKAKAKKKPAVKAKKKGKR
jgi:nucleoside 2-deoxyribosyltransferase